MGPAAESGGVEGGGTVSLDAEGVPKGVCSQTGRLPQPAEGPLLLRVPGGEPVCVRGGPWTAAARFPRHGAALKHTAELEELEATLKQEQQGRAAAAGESQRLRGELDR